MKQKVSDYIADRLAQEGICQVFTVTGGGAMHLNDSLDIPRGCPASPSIMNRRQRWRQKLMRG